MAFTEIGANTLDDAYEIENSCRFNEGDSPKLTRTPGSDGNRDIWTFSCWFKKTNVDETGDSHIFSCGSGGDDLTSIALRGSGDDEVIELSSYTSAGSTTHWNIATPGSYRDPSAWYHLVFAVDTTQASISNGLKLWINGEAISYTGSTWVQNADTCMNSDDHENVIGARQNNNDMFFDGYLADVHFIDGTQKQATDFGKTDTNGVWVPIKYSGSYGTNGFFMEFKQTGTSANASGKGADTSGNTNHFDDTNMDTYDITTDTPTNNFATLNPLANALTNPITLSEGNLKAVGDSSSWEMISSTIGAKNGKWYWEVKLTALSSYAQIGITNDYAIISDALESYFGHAGSGVAFGKGQDATIYHTGGNSTSYGTTYSAGDMASVALDLDNNFIYFAKDGTWMDYSSATGDPTSGSSGTGGYAITANELYIPAVACNQATWEVNFGNPSFSISSGNADANGYGNFEYAPPSGYYALCTKNLGEYG